MRLSVTISKTFQEEAYEPLRIELGLIGDEIALGEDKGKKYTADQITRDYKHFSQVLQDSIDEIYLERRKLIEEVKRRRR